MHCPNCDQVSLGSCCHYCGACEGQAVGFSPLDIFDPIGLGKDMGDAYKSGEPTINPFDPIGTGRTIGTDIAQGGSGLKQTTSSIASLASAAKWVMIGTAVVVGGIVVYGVVKFLPKALDVAASNAKESGKAGARIAERYAGGS